MAGLNANSVFYNVTTTIAMLAGRYGLAALALALAGRFAAQRCVPATAGTLPGDTPTFGALVFATILLVGALYFFPALALGPRSWSSFNTDGETDPSRVRGYCDRIQARGRKRRHGRSDRYRSTSGDRFKRRCPARESPSRERIRRDREPGATQFRRSGDVAALRGGIGNRAASDCSGLLWPSGKERASGLAILRSG